MLVSVPIDTLVSLLAPYLLLLYQLVASYAMNFALLSFQSLCLVTVIFLEVLYLGYLVVDANKDRTTRWYQTLPDWLPSLCIHGIACYYWITH